MENVGNLFGSTAFQIFLSSAVVAALITSLFSYQASRETNRRLIDIELMKRESELTTFRYLRVYNAIEEISGLPDIDYTFGRIKDEKFVRDKDLSKRVIKQTTERYSTVSKIFNRVKPLMDESFLSDVISAIAEEERVSNLLTQAVILDQPFPDGMNEFTLAEACRKAGIEILEALSQQVSSLTKVTSLLHSS